MNSTSTQNTTPSNLPEKFIDTETGELKLDALINSYLALEKKMSSSLPAPTDPENKQRLLKALGVPDSPEEYSINVDNGLLSPDENVNQRLHEMMFTGEQVQLVYDLAGEFMVPMISKIAAEYKADMEVERLTREFGGQEQWAEVSRQLLKYGQQNLPQNVFENLAGSYDGVMALYKMMNNNQSPAIDKQISQIGASDEKELQSMMRDPKYWKERDPQFIEKVTKGFEALYAEK